MKLRGVKESGCPFEERRKAQTRGSAKRSVSATKRHNGAVNMKELVQQYQEEKFLSNFQPKRPKHVRLQGSLSEKGMRSRRPPSSLVNTRKAVRRKAQGGLKEGGDSKVADEDDMSQGNEQMLCDLSEVKVLVQKVTSRRR